MADNIWTAAVEGIAARGRANNGAEGDYHDEEGFLCCGKCRTRKEGDITIGEKTLRVPHLCKCESEASRQREAEEKAAEFRKQCERLRKDGITDPSYLSQNFTQDDNRNARISDVCRRYVEHWPEMKADNNVTGAAFDITTLVSGAKWSTKRSGSPASLELTAIVNDEIQWSHGGIVTLLDDKTGLFYGYVVKISQNEKEQVQITAYDQTWYLKKNKDTYVFKGKRADQVLKQIAEDFKLKTGSLANTGYSIPSMIEDGQTLFDIVLKAIDYTLINTGKMFVLWDNFGKLTLTDVETAKLDLFVGDGSLATGFTYESEIDSEAYNKIKLVKDNKKTGKRDVYIFQDSKNMTLWGILQDYEVVDEDMNEAQIKKRGGQMLELYNRPKRSFSVSAIADLSVRAGRALYIGIGAVGVKSFFIVEEATHDLLKETMSLKLKVV